MNVSIRTARGEMPAYLSAPSRVGQQELVGNAQPRAHLPATREGLAARE
jgi:hypothetical protein